MEKLFKLSFYLILVLLGIYLSTLILRNASNY